MESFPEIADADLRVFAHTVRNVGLRQPDDAWLRQAKARLLALVSHDADTPNSWVQDAEARERH